MAAGLEIHSYIKIITCHISHLTWIIAQKQFSRHMQSLCLKVTHTFSSPKKSVRFVYKICSSLGCYGLISEYSISTKDNLLPVYSLYDHKNRITCTSLRMPSSSLSSFSSWEGTSARVFPCEFYRRENIPIRDKDTPIKISRVSNNESVCFQS